MYYECKKCGKRLEELQKLGKVKFCGDFYKCTDCNNDITKDPESWFKECMDMAKLPWDTNPSEEDDGILASVLKSKTKMKLWYQK